MIVLDASAVIDWLLQTPAGWRIEERIYSRNESLHAPHILDLEVMQVLRRLVREESISLRRAEEAICDFLDLKISRYPHFVFLERIWGQRNNLTAYDAAYVVLAETLGAALVTRDQGMASAGSRGVNVEVY